MNISKRVMGIAPSVTLEIDAQAKKLKADGLDVVGFGAVSYTHLDVYKRQL